MFAYDRGMQLRLDAADRLVELVEERRGPVYVEEAARRLFALRHAPVGMARRLQEEFELLVDPGVPIGPAISALTGLRDADLRGRPRPVIAVRRFLEFAGEAVLVAHNARFDLAF